MGQVDRLLSLRFPREALQVDGEQNITWPDSAKIAVFVKDYDR